MFADVTSLMDFGVIFGALLLRPVFGLSVKGNLTHAQAGPSRMPWRIEK